MRTIAPTPWRPIPPDDLLRFVIAHDVCGPDLQIKSVDHPDGARIVSICPGCGERLAIPVTPTEALAFVQRAAMLSAEDVERVRDRASFDVAASNSIPQGRRVAPLHLGWGSRATNQCRFCRTGVPRQAIGCEFSPALTLGREAEPRDYLGEVLGTRRGRVSDGTD